MSLPITAWVLVAPGVPGDAPGLIEHITGQIGHLELSRAGVIQTYACRCMGMDEYLEAHRRACVALPDIEPVVRDNGTHVTPLSERIARAMTFRERNLLRDEEAAWRAAHDDPLREQFEYEIISQAKAAGYRAHADCPSCAGRGAYQVRANGRARYIGAFRLRWHAAIPDARAYMEQRAHPHALVADGVWQELDDHIDVWVGKVPLALRHWWREEITAAFEEMPEMTVAEIEIVRPHTW